MTGKTFGKALRVLALTLVVSVALGVVLYGPAFEAQAGAPDDAPALDGTIVWKGECPADSHLEVYKVNRDVIVNCFQPSASDAGEGGDKTWERLCQWRADLKVYPVSQGGAGGLLVECLTSR